MKETTPAVMPPCFEKWCQRFDDVFTHKAQKREFRHYVGGLLGESERKNLFQMAENAVGVYWWLKTQRGLQNSYIYSDFSIG